MAMSLWLFKGFPLIYHLLLRSIRNFCLQHFPISFRVIFLASIFPSTKNDLKCFVFFLKCCLVDDSFQSEGTEQSQYSDSAYMTNVHVSVKSQKGSRKRSSKFRSKNSGSFKYNFRRAKTKTNFWRKRRKFKNILNILSPHFLSLT